MHRQLNGQKEVALVSAVDLTVTGFRRCLKVDPRKMPSSCGQFPQNTYSCHIF